MADGSEYPFFRKAPPGRYLVVREDLINGYLFPTQHEFDRARTANDKAFDLNRTTRTLPTDDVYHVLDDKGHYVSPKFVLC